MGIVKVNRTGGTFKVYKSNACNTNEVVGTIYNNEIFSWTGEYPGSGASGDYIQSICFRNSTGKPANGWVPGTAPFATNLSNLAAKKVTLSGKTYYAFKMRRAEPLYDRSANDLKKSASKDRYILTEGSTSGATHPEWLAEMHTY